MPVFKDIFSGYRMMYCYGYIHRDLKPANLLIHENKIKIADFGFVKKCLNGLRHSESYNVGTPLYMAP
jgi:serine/threonine protein kinase